MVYQTSTDDNIIRRNIKEYHVEGLWVPVPGILVLKFALLVNNVRYRLYLNIR